MNTAQGQLRRNHKRCESNSLGSLSFDVQWSIDVLNNEEESWNVWKEQRQILVQ